VHAEGPVIEEEGAILVPLKKAACFLGHAIFDMVPWLAFLSPEGPGGEVTIFSAGSWTVCSWEIDGKALLPWGVGWWAEMPFAEMSGLVTCVLQEFGKGDVVGRESGEAIGDPSWPIALDQSFF
jgi:hypothetical protein